MAARCCLRSLSAAASSASRLCFVTRADTVMSTRADALALLCLKHGYHMAIWRSARHMAQGAACTRKRVSDSHVTWHRHGTHTHTVHTHACATLRNSRPALKLPQTPPPSPSAVHDPGPCLMAPKGRGQGPAAMQQRGRGVPGRGGGRGAGGRGGRGVNDAHLAGRAGGRGHGAGGRRGVGRGRGAGGRGLGAARRGVGRGRGANAPEVGPAYIRRVAQNNFAVSSRVRETCLSWIN